MTPYTDQGVKNLGLIFAVVKNDIRQLLWWKITNSKNKARVVTASNVEKIKWSLKHYFSA